MKKSKKTTPTQPTSVEQSVPPASPTDQSRMTHRIPCSNEPQPSIALAKEGLDPKRRGKIATLPKSLRHEINLMIEDHASSRKIIAWLAERGHTGINDVNISIGSTAITAAPVAISIG